MGQRWNIWVFAAIALLCIGMFVLAYIVALIFILIKDYPTFFTDPNLAKASMNNKTFLLHLLTAKNLWLTTFVADGALAVTTLGLAHLAFRTGLTGFGLKPRPLPRALLLGLEVAGALIVISIVLDAIITKFFGPHPQLAALALTKHKGPFDFALDFMTVSIFAPVAEEIFFRGFIFAGLAQRMSPLLAAIISAMLFAAAHFDPWSTLQIFVVGLGLAGVYYYTGSLRANILAHATFNLFSLILVYAFPQLVNS